MPAILALPDFDLPTRSSSGYLLRWVAPRLGPVHLLSVLDRREAFMFAAPRSDIIIATGHGSPDALTGQNETIIWGVGKYDPREVEGKVIYLLSCQTGLRLGPDLVRNGAAAFMGFTDDYIWVCDADLAPAPWSDEMSATCLMPEMEAINALLDGKTVKEAHDIKLASYEKNAGAEENELIRSCIKFNRRNAILLGNPEAKVRPRPRIILPIPPPPIILPVKT